jgi:NAD(P)-dependent dehydrogenase (short-subunit alcohol dehydrogenase family)
LDVTSTAQIQAAAGQVESLDMLINAGIARPDDLTDPAVLERHLAVNLAAPASLPPSTGSGHQAVLKSVGHAPKDVEPPVNPS